MNGRHWAEIQPSTSEVIPNVNTDMKNAIDRMSLSQFDSSNSKLTADRCNISHGRHWGEIPTVATESIPNVDADIEKAMDKFFLLEYNSNCEKEPNTDNSIVLMPQDPLVMYAISLHKHMTHMSEIIRLAELAIENNVRPSEDAAPPVPPLPNVELKHRINCLNFIPKNETDFTQGKEVEVPVLSETIVQKVLRRSICTLFSHLGYESTHESILNILVDVVKEFYKIFCSKLECAIYDEMHNDSGFPHAIERVLVELGMGGVKGLHDYYRSRVIKYVNVLRGRCQVLNDHYNQLLAEKTPSDVDDLGKVMGIEIKKEEIEENPEVHLLDGEIELSSLETGFQLLNSLEEANLQNFMEGDEILTTESPGNITSEPKYSPLPKKKK
ncbi:STAGA complex 65 subunit gamma-like [Harmonia axyridis]|uniref:STAGA complex 65 subunit gamma-like n=1 Tax=Harmonia axyridis TaxID=115357 RepID=UPI001E277A14|nr:STAGA complex 65 subunit gamma-like [Harmonia axyridis]